MCATLPTASGGSTTTPRADVFTYRAVEKARVVERGGDDGHAQILRDVLERRVENCPGRLRWRLASEDFRPTSTVAAPLAASPRRSTSSSAARCSMVEPSIDAEVE